MKFPANRVATPGIEVIETVQLYKVEVGKFATGLLSYCPPYHEYDGAPSSARIFALSHLMNASKYSPVEVAKHSMAQIR